MRCEIHHILICSICARDCHSNCTLKPIDVNEFHDCECNDQNHSGYNEFTFTIAKKLKKEEIQDKSKCRVVENISNLWPVQILNTLFLTTGTFQQLIPFVQDIINKGAQGEIKKFEF